MLAKIYVTLKKGVLDPQGKAVQHSLAALGFDEVTDVRLGKYLEVRVDHMVGNEVEARIKDMCDKLLANPVIEDYRFEITGEGE